MRNKDTIQTQQMIRRIFLLTFGTAAILIPITFVICVISVFMWDPKPLALATVTGVPGIACAFIAGFWWSDAGVPMKLKFSKKAMEKDKISEDYQEFMEFREKREIERQIKAEADNIAYKGTIYSRDWQGHYTDDYGHRLPVFKELS